jgi:glycosyltransferase involved in cell wall biosynthesis
LVSILYDGWPLVYNPNGASALHLLALLAFHPQTYEAIVALPAQGPDWLPESIKYRVLPTADTSSGRLVWEQRVLPLLQKSLGTGLLHLTTYTAPLISRPISVVSPTGAVEQETRRPRQTTRDRLREALGQGGMAQARAIFWPSDLPDPPRPFSAPIIRLPTVVHPSFLAGEQKIPNKNLDYSGLDIPDQYILYHGPQTDLDLQRLLQAWSWAAGPIGEHAPLLAAGFTTAGAQKFTSLAREYNLEDRVRVLPVLSPENLAQFYKNASAVFHPAPVEIWGGAVRQGLALELPIVGSESRWADSVVGEAGILRDAQDRRGLGAALITVIVEESVAQGLVKASKRKNLGKDALEFAAQIQKVYQKLL